MKAIVQDRYGPPTDVLRLAEIDEPTMRDGDLLVRVHAASVNPYDWHTVTGKPYLVRLNNGLRRPKAPVPGADFAGTVVAVAAGVDGFQPGDEVFGEGGGAYAEVMRVRARNVARKPSNVSFEQAAATPMAGLTALQALRDSGRLQPGQRVLVAGASGGVGTFAVQIAKHLGAEVTGVCSTRNVDMVRSIGADHIVDYTTEDFTRSGETYDVIVDMVAAHRLRDIRRALASGGSYVAIGAQEKGNLIGPLLDVAKLPVLSRLWRTRMVWMLARVDAGDLELLQKLLESGAVDPVIDRVLPLEQVPAALEYQGEGHTRGKTVISL